MNQLVEEHKSLWRIKNMHQSDAGGCETYRSFWEKMEQDKGGRIGELTDLIKNHLE